MHCRFKVLFDNLSPYHSYGRLIAKHNKKKGGRRLITAWTWTQGSFAVLQIIFGMTAGCLSLWLRFGGRLLIQILCNNERSCPLMPTNNKIAGFISAVIQILRNNEHSRPSMPRDNKIAGFICATSTKYPALTNCWGAIDGLKLQLQRSGNNKIQNLFFNGWTHDHYVCNLFLFSPDGKIRACYIDAPGTMHDSTMADSTMASWSGIYKKLDDLYETTGAKVVVDSAFALERHQLVYKSYQSNIDNQGRV
jgi:hypothetical protein